MSILARRVVNPGLAAHGLPHLGIHQSVSGIIQYVLSESPTYTNSLRTQADQSGSSRAYNVSGDSMKVKFAPERPVTIAALTMITAGVVPAINSSPLNLIWTFAKRLLG